MVDVLVKFCNVIIKHNHNPRRWLKVVDVVIEKGKGPRIDKLRILEMIEANLQLVMRILLGSRMNERIETDARVSKCNYGSRSGHSIENELVEKRLTMDCAKKSGEENVHAMSDLEAFYDRQLPELCGLVEESLGANRKVVTLVSKVLTRLEHHVGTVNGVSKDKHGGEKDVLGRIGQGNVFSGVACRDVSYLIFKQLKKRKLGIKIESYRKGKIEHRLVIARVDDADFCTSGDNCETKMKKIASHCMKMYEATGGKVQKDKVHVCCWKWENNKIMNAKVDIILKEEVIKQIKVHESIKTLGVCVNPQLNWNVHFGYVKNKMQDVVRKLMRTEIRVHQACMCFNVCMLTNVFWMRNIKI